MSPARALRSVIVISCVVLAYVGASVAPTGAQGRHFEAQVIGLHRRTVEQVDDSLVKRFGADQGLDSHACGANLHQIGFPRSAAITFTDEKGRHKTVVSVVEPEDVNTVGALPLPSSSAPLPTAWEAALEPFVHPSGHWLQLSELEGMLVLYPAVQRGRLDSAQAGVKKYQVTREQRALWSFLRAHATPSDRDRAIAILSSDSNASHRAFAVAILSSFPTDDLVWKTLLHAIRDSDERIGFLVNATLSQWATLHPHRIDWSSHAEDVRAALAGTNLWIFPDLMNLFIKTELSPSLAKSVLAGNGTYLLGYAALKDVPKPTALAHTLLTQLSGQAYGNDIEKWNGWVKSLSVPAQSAMACAASAIPAAAMRTGSDSVHRPGSRLPTGAYASLVCRDFYDAVNGEWAARTPLPVDTTKDTVRRLGAKRDTIRVDHFSLMQNRARQTLIKILTDARAAASTTKDPVTRVLGNFYNSCMITPPQDSIARAKEKDGGVNRCLTATDEVLNNALGRAYVNVTSTPETEARVKAMAEQLRTSMANRIKQLTWMSPETKLRALSKLAGMRFRVGNPDKGEDYNALVLSPTDFEENKRKAAYVQYQRDIKEFGVEADKSKVGLRQYTVNAYYLPNMNAMEIPAVLFQEPFFNPNRDAVENYAGLGVIVAHEITHAFDTYGSQYDSSGQANNWWTDTDRENFLARTDKLVNVYNAFVTKEGVRLSGLRTLDENIADLGGTNLAFDAYTRTLGKHPESRAGGITPEQRFFLAYAEAWQEKSGPTYAMDRARNDTHSPAHWRVNGVLVNMPAFARAFGCKPGDPMVRSPAERAEIW